MFNTKAVVSGNEIVEDFSLNQYLGEKYVVFFFYPADFTFVCPTELIAFQSKIAEFEKRNTVVVAASTDSATSHWKWLQTPRNEGGIEGAKVSHSSRSQQNDIYGLRCIGRLVLCR